MARYHLQAHLSGWLIQAPGPLTATQIKTARQLALAYGVTVETRSGNPDLGEFAGGATTLGIVIALSVLAMSVGLIRSETARDLRTLTAAVLILLLGLPLIAAVGGWLFAGREPPAVARQPIE